MPLRTRQPEHIAVCWSYDETGRNAKKQKGPWPMYNQTEPCTLWQRAGYAYVPEQKLEKLYPPEVAICEGTIFPELNITICLLYTSFLF